MLVPSVIAREGGRSTNRETLITGCPPEPVIGPAKAGPVGGHDSLLCSSRRSASAGANGAQHPYRALGNFDDLRVGIAGPDHVADVLAHQRARHRRDIRQCAVRRIGLVFADDAPGLLPSVVALD